jgi:hypothetical protein
MSSSARQGSGLVIQLSDDPRFKRVESDSNVLSPSTSSDPTKVRDLHDDPRFVARQVLSSVTAYLNDPGDLGLGQLPMPGDKELEEAALYDDRKDLPVRQGMRATLQTSLLKEYFPLLRGLCLVWVDADLRVRYAFIDRVLVTCTPGWLIVHTTAPSPADSLFLASIHPPKEPNRLYVMLMPNEGVSTILRLEPRGRRKHPA